MGIRVLTKSSKQNQILVGGLEHEFYDFPYIGNVIIPTDFHSIIFQRDGSTTNQNKTGVWNWFDEHRKSNRVSVSDCRSFSTSIGVKYINIIGERYHNISIISTNSIILMVS